MLKHKIIQAERGMVQFGQMDSLGQYCRIYKSNGDLMIEDTGSPNGIALVNKRGAPIKIGKGANSKTAVLQKGTLIFLEKNKVFQVNMNGICPLPGFSETISQMHHDEGGRTFFGKFFDEGIRQHVRYYKGPISLYSDLERDKNCFICSYYDAVRLNPALIDKLVPSEFYFVNRNDPDQTMAIPENKEILVAKDVLVIRKGDSFIIDRKDDEVNLGLVRNTPRPKEMPALRMNAENGSARPEAQGLAKVAEAPQRAQVNDAQPVLPARPKEPESAVTQSLGRNLVQELTESVLDNSISREHGQVIKKGNEYYYQDNSSNGSVLIHPRALRSKAVHHDTKKLMDGTVLKIGSSLLEFDEEQGKFRTVKPGQILAAGREKMNRDVRMAVATPLGFLSRPSYSVPIPIHTTVADGKAKTFWICSYADTVRITGKLINNTDQDNYFLIDQDDLRSAEPLRATKELGKDYTIKTEGSRIEIYENFSRRDRLEAALKAKEEAKARSEQQGNGIIARMIQGFGGLFSNTNGPK
ncbi:MAG: FHA domain-containing protein [Candidatus Margulisiibacteriota bacterium]|jgi:hypothetical protein